MLPTQDYLDKIAATPISATFRRSHAGSIVKALIKQLQDRHINITEGTIEAGPFIANYTINASSIERVMEQLTIFASINADDVTWGWKLDELARLHFAPVDHLPEN